MKEKISSKLRLLLCFGVIVFISLVSSQKVEAHSADMGGRTEGYVYDAYNPWDATYVGWFTHDKKVTGSVKWYTKGYYLTTYPLSDYVIPAGAFLVAPLSTNGLPSPKCTTSGYVDTAHLFDRWASTTWGAKAGATFNDDGVMTVYAQPVIGTKHKNTNGAWVDDGVTLTSLASWVRATALVCSLRTRFPTATT